MGGEGFSILFLFFFVLFLFWTEEGKLGGPKRGSCGDHLRDRDKEE